MIPDICDFIKWEVIERGSSEAGKCPEAAGVAVGALAKMGKEALPAASDLLMNENANVRLCGATALSRMGKPALPLLIEARGREKDRLIFSVLQKIIDAIQVEDSV